jgi:hypothetical protein
MRGQISMEAIMVIGMAIIILTSFFNVNWERYYTAKDLGEAGEAKMAGELLATAINAGYSNGEGFSLYVSSDKLNFTKLDAMGVELPFTVNSTARTINIEKNMTSLGGVLWNVSIPIIPANLLQADPTSQYPELTIFNNGTHVIIYANQSNIVVQ